MFYTKSFFLRQALGLEKKMSEDNEVFILVTEMYRKVMEKSLKVRSEKLLKPGYFTQYAKNCSKGSAICFGCVHVSV